MSSSFFGGLIDELVKLGGAVGKAIYDKNGKYVGFKRTGSTSDIKSSPATTPSAPAAPRLKLPSPSVPRPGSLKRGAKTLNKGLRMGGQQKGIGKYLPR